MLVKTRQHQVADTFAKTGKCLLFKYSTYLPDHAFVLDFAYQFLSLLIGVSKGCLGKGLVFDRYITQSLKSITRS